MSAILDKTSSSAPAKLRDSSLELFRIVLMLMIIAHHYVVNSGLCQEILKEGAGNISWRGLSFLMFGAWGKVGINCFVLITGYFMCTGRATIQKFLKLYFQILFYNVVIGSVFMVVGLKTFKYATLFYWLLPFKNLTSSFTAGFLAFFLFIPFVNALINALDRKKHFLLLAALLSVFSIFPTFTFGRISIANNYVCWFAIVYIVGAYVRKYPLKVFDHRGYMACLAGTAFVAGCLSVAVTANLLPRMAGIRLSWCYWLCDSEKLTALAAAVAFFLFFRSMRLPYLKFVNIVALATFGVLLIHTRTETMRHWLWCDVCKNVEEYGAGIGRAILVVICVYVVCVLLELLRQQIFEKVGVLVRGNKIK